MLRGECGKEYLSCMTVRYCNAACQRNHWPTHKKQCKLQAAELHARMRCSRTHRPRRTVPFASDQCVVSRFHQISSVPVYDFAIANEELAKEDTEAYYSMLREEYLERVYIIYTFSKSGNMGKCPFCNAERISKTDEERVEDLIKRVEANDADAMHVLSSHYYHGLGGLGQDLKKAIELWTRAG